MNRRINWLHISDLHARHRDDWDSREILDALMRDLKALRKESGMSPTFIFMTGDAAFGSVPGDPLGNQYQLVRNFLDGIRKAYEPEFPLRNVYLVPGNHDIDRAEVTAGETEWLRNPKRTLPEVLAAVRDGGKQWRTWMDRFGAYRTFLNAYGLLHLNPEDAHLVWGDAQEVAGVRVGIVGLNSAWSAVDDNDKGHLWSALDWQIPVVKQRVGPVAFTIALIHHPANWLTAAEDPSVGRRLRHEFEVVLHGHEHQEWVDINVDGRVLASAGACYQSSWMASGYSFTSLDLDTAEMSIWLRTWDKVGRGWVAREIANKTSHGVWKTSPLPWVRAAREPTSIAETEQTRPSGAVVASTADEHYTARFCENVVHQHDFLELFGCDIPRELQRHQLSVTYVSLNLASTKPQGAEIAAQRYRDAPSLIDRSAEEHDPDAAPDEDRVDGSSASFERALNNLTRGSARLLILGPAGAGKSTLLRWCAIEAAQRRRPIDPHVAGDDKVALWRTQIPVLIRLRDCPDGRLPAVADMPKFVAKHLQAAPQTG